MLRLTQTIRQCLAVSDCDAIEKTLTEINQLNNIIATFRLNAAVMKRQIADIHATIQQITTIALTLSTDEGCLAAEELLQLVVDMKIHLRPVTTAMTLQREAGNLASMICAIKSFEAVMREHARLFTPDSEELFVEKAYANITTTHATLLDATHVRRIVIITKLQLCSIINYLKNDDTKVPLKVHAANDVNIFSRAENYLRSLSIKIDAADFSTYYHAYHLCLRDFHLQAALIDIISSNISRIEANYHHPVVESIFKVLYNPELTRAKITELNQTKNRLLSSYNLAKLAEIIQETLNNTTIMSDRINIPALGKNSSSKTFATSLNELLRFCESELRNNTQNIKPISSRLFQQEQNKTTTTISLNRNTLTN